MGKHLLNYSEFLTACLLQNYFSINAEENIKIIRNINKDITLLMTGYFFNEIIYSDKK